MKKIFTVLLCLSIATSLLWAQDVDRSFVFIDENGTEVENGATIVRNLIQFDHGTEFISAGLSIQKTSAAASSDYIKLNYTIEQIDNGSYQLCYPTTCNTRYVAGVYETAIGQPMGDMQDIQSEWFPTANGECVVTLTIEIFTKQSGFPPTYEHKAFGPSVTVHFVKSPGTPDDGAAYVQLADGVYMDGTTLYITSGVTSLGSLKVNPSEIYCYATIPPACLSNTFTGYDATLHVPAAGMVSYFTALYWYNFNNILSDAIEPLSVTMNTTEAEVEMGQQLSLSATVAPSNATPKNVYWSSTNPSVATVSNTGMVTAVAAGECDILATCVDKIAFCHVTVVSPRVTVTLDKHEARLLPNHTMTLMATCTPPVTNLVVTTSNPAVAIPRYVNGTIMVVGVSEGIATITVSTNDGWCNPDTCEVTVYTLLGDVNCDGYVDVSDVTTVISHILGNEVAQFSAKNADVNHDNDIDVSDVTTIIAYILGSIDLNPPVEPETQTFTVNGVSFKMVTVEGGTFMMGATSEQGSDAFDDERPIHEVTLSSYSIGETEVTQALWVEVMGSNPSEFTGDLNCPVEKVSWNDCLTFITKLNQMTGKTFRFPTEAEWEFAARGGNKSQGYKYSGSNNIDDVAWYYYVNAPRITHTVATKAPNELGLYDMSGNVLEWCQDWYGSYSSEALSNPVGPSTGSYRVCRGGSFAHTAAGCRVSERRSYNNPSYTYRSLGLRLALDPDVSPTPDEHEYVDLGLPSGTLWATCNIGASRPEERGYYFAWGETDPKEVYNWSTYKWCNGSNKTLTKYCIDGYYGDNGFTDGKTELDPEDDAAYVNWGPSWRMPTWEQLNELMMSCSWRWTSNYGVQGYQLEGSNGRTLFLPAGGIRWDGTISDVNLNGYYWSRSLNLFYHQASYLYFYSGNIRWGDSYDRCRGFNVRAVRVSQN